MEKTLWHSPSPQEVYRGVVLFFFSIALSRLFAAIPFVGMFLSFIGITFGLLFLFDSKTQKLRIPALAVVLGFFLEIYRIQLLNLQEMYEFLILSLLALVVYVYRRV